MKLEGGALNCRTALPSDAAAIADIYNQGIADRVATFETAPRSAADIEAWFDQRLPILAVVTSTGEVVAYAAAFSYAARCCYSGIAEFSVYGRRDWRGRGAGKLAMQALIAACRDKGLWKLVSRIFPEN